MLNGHSINSNFRTIYRISSIRSYSLYNRNIFLRRNMDILKEVEKLPEKKKISHHKESILLMRKKGYSFRNIAEFLTSKGIKTDHTRIFKLVKAHNKGE